MTNWLLAHLFSGAFAVTVALVAVHFAPHEKVDP